MHLTDFVSSNLKLHVHVQCIWLIGTINRPLHSKCQENTMFIYTYKRAVCVCWFVGLLVCFLSATRHLSTLRRCLRVAESRISRRREWPCARGQEHAQREHSRACRTTSQRKIAALIYDAFQKQSRTRACCRIRDWRDFQKENQHATSQVQFTVCLLLECLLFESY